jgi:hypothetical protein
METWRALEQGYKNIEEIGIHKGGLTDGISVCSMGHINLVVCGSVRFHSLLPIIPISPEDKEMDRLREDCMSYLRKAANISWECGIAGWNDAIRTSKEDIKKAWRKAIRLAKKDAGVYIDAPSMATDRDSRSTVSIDM